MEGRRLLAKCTWGKGEGAVFACERHLDLCECSEMMVASESIRFACNGRGAVVACGQSAGVAQQVKVYRFNGCWTLKGQQVEVFKLHRLDRCWDVDKRDAMDRQYDADALMHTLCQKPCLQCTAIKRPKLDHCM